MGTKKPRPNLLVPGTETKVDRLADDVDGKFVWQNGDLEICDEYGLWVPIKPHSQ
jgi:hypothetical protein